MTFFFDFLHGLLNETFKSCRGFFPLEALATKAEANIVSGFLNYVTTTQKNAIQEPAKGQRFTTENVGDVEVWGGREDPSSSWS